MPTVRQLCGWAGTDKGLLREAQEEYPFPELNIVGSYYGGRMALFEIVEKGLGEYPENIAQQVGDCFHGDTLVSMADGTRKPIKDVVVGDVVLSHKNIARTVTAVIKKPYSGKLITVEAKSSFESVKCTPDHRFMTEDGLVPIQDLGVQDEILLSYGSTLDRQDVHFVLSDLLSEKGFEHELENGKVRLKGGGKWVNNIIALDDDLAELIGLFIAEGGKTSRNNSFVRIDFNLGRHEKDLIYRVKELIKFVFGLEAKEVELPSKPTVTLVRLDSTIVSEFIAYLVPGNTYTKRVPEQIFKATDGVKLACLRGWYQGDGHLRIENGQNLVLGGVSVCNELILDFERLARSLKITTSTYKRRKEIHQTKESNSLHVYGKHALTIFPDQDEIVCHKTSYRESKNGILYQIKNKTEEDFDGDVYCLEVEEDHTFIANGFAVSNCVSWGARNAIENLQAYEIYEKGELETWERVFAPYLYGTGRVLAGGGRLSGDGSLGVWQAEAVTRWGVISEKTPGCPKYSGSIARKWGAKPGPPKEFIQIGEQHKLDFDFAAAKVRTWEQLVASVMNGYPVTVASNIGYEMKAGSNGFHRRSGSWAHQMCIVMVDDEHSTPYCGIYNSWGDAHGTIIDFKTGRKWPKGMLRVVKDDVKRMLDTDDSFSFSNFNGFNPRKIDPDWFRLI